MAIFDGGCLCGAVRYRAYGSATNRCFCHCQSCRKATGAPFVAWATFPAAQFEVTRGQLALCKSSEKVARGFCAACGTSITYAHEDRPKELDVALATLDDPVSIPPEYHIWASHKLSWIVLGGRLPQYSEWRTGG